MVASEAKLYGRAAQGLACPLESRSVAYGNPALPSKRCVFYGIRERGYLVVALHPFGRMVDSALSALPNGGI